MSYYRNIIQGQYQLGDTVFGRGTNVIVDNFDVKPYDMNVQDYQRSRSNEINFGQDYIKPTTIELGLNVMYNMLLPPFAGTIPNFWHNMVDVDDLAREWGFDEGREVWGEMKPLYVCRRDRIPKIVFGRPGQFGPQPVSDRAEFVPIVCEFRRVDNLGYGILEKSLLLNQATLSGNINGTMGTFPSWMRVLIRGPINGATLNFSQLYKTPEPFVMHIGKNIAAGEVVEVSSYPWSRRVVSSTGENYAPYIDSDTPYLDRLRFLHNQPCAVSLTGTAITSQTQVAVLYRDAYRTL